MRRVVVTGLGLVTPLASGVRASWGRLVKGESGIGMMEGFDTSDLPCKIAGHIPRGHNEGGGATDFYNPDDWFEPKDQRKVDHFIPYAIAASSEALDDAGEAGR